MGKPIREFYNEDKKRGYLAETFSENDEQMMRNTRAIFSKSSDMEKALDKDLCEFNHNNFITLFEKCGYIEQGAFYTHRTHLMGYVKWCVKKGYCSSDSIIEINRLRYQDITGSVRDKAEFFCTAEELFECIKTVYELHGSSQTYYEPIQAFYGLYWYGLENEEIYLFKPSQINASEKKIKTANNTYAISPDFTELLLRVADYTYFELPDGRKKYYADSEYFFKSTNKIKTGMPISENWHIEKNRRWRSLVDELETGNKWYGKRISCITISKCGMFSRLYEREKRGELITDVEMKARNLNLSPRGRKNFIYNRLTEYERWKNFYGLSAK